MLKILKKFNAQNMKKFDVNDKIAESSFIFFLIIL